MIQSDLLIPRSPTGKGLPGVVFLSLGQGWVVLISFLIKCQLKKSTYILFCCLLNHPIEKHAGQNGFIFLIEADVVLLVVVVVVVVVAVVAVAIVCRLVLRGFLELTHEKLKLLKRDT